MGTVERRMRLALVIAPILMMVAPALAQDVPRPDYPPGFDCGSVPAGSQRQACEASQLGPVGDDPNGNGSVTGAQPETPGTVSPPTMPDEPGGENRGGGPGSQGAAGGVGN